MTEDQARIYRIPEREAMAIPRAAVDLGSNTFRLLVGSVADGQVIPLTRQLATVRLGESLHRTGLIGETALARARDTLAAFRETIHRYAPGSVRAVGTAALRAAANRDFFLAEAAAALGTPVEVIDGRQEALLSATGAIAAMGRQKPGAIWLADVGGGSSELIRAELASPALPPGRRLAISSVHSLPMGAVNLTETFLRLPIAAAEELAALAGHIETAFTQALAPPIAPARLVAIGGTATALAALDCGMTVYDGRRIQNHQLTAERLDAILARLGGLTAGQRNLLPGLDQGRGEIILGGLMIFRHLLKALGGAEMTVSDGGLPEGLLLSPQL